MVTCVIGLGSNLGDGQENLLEAWSRLGRLEGVTAGGLSSPYRTEPVGMTSPHWFTNAVGWLETNFEPLELLRRLLALEQELGRVRPAAGDAGPADRPVDLDLLFYGEQVHNSQELVLPHPGIEERLFVLEPLAEILPHLVHPGQGRSVRQLRDALRVRQPGWEQRVVRDRWQRREVA